MKCVIHKLSDAIAAESSYKEKFFIGAVNNGNTYEDIILRTGQRIIIDVVRPKAFTSGQVAFYAENNISNVAHAVNYNNESVELVVAEESNGNFLRARLNNYTGGGELAFIFKIKIFEK